MKHGNRPYGDARVSPARREIASAIAGVRGAFTVDSLAEELRSRRTPVGLATIYRAVAALEQAGTLARVGEHNGTALYVLCGREEHHHHLVCTGCGMVEPVECPLDDSLLRSAGEAGFVITRHEIRLYGMCRRCLRTQNAGES